MITDMYIKRNDGKTMFIPVMDEVLDFLQENGMEIEKDIATDFPVEDIDGFLNSLFKSLQIKYSKDVNIFNLTGCVVDSRKKIIYSDNLNGYVEEMQQVLKQSYFWLIPSVVEFLENWDIYYDVQEREYRYLKGSEPVQISVY